MVTSLRHLFSQTHDRKGSNRKGRSRPRFEQLEQRALLAVTATYYDDFISIPGVGDAAAWGNSNTEEGVLVLTIDSAPGGDDLFMRVVNNQYTFATDVNFQNPINIFTHGYTAPRNNPVNGTPGGGGGLIGTSIASGFARSYTLQTVNPDFSDTPTTLGTVGTFTSRFSTIYVRTSGLTDGVDTPTFTIVGASQNVTKSLIVDLSDDAGEAVSESVISIGAPVAVAENAGTIGPGGRIADDATNPGPLMPLASPSGVIPGGALPEGTILLRSESITVNASVTAGAGRSIYMVSELGQTSDLNGDVISGININQAVSTSGQVLVEVVGTGFNVNAGGRIGNGATGSSSVLLLDLQDADARIAGNVRASDQFYFVRQSGRDPADATTRTITTRSASTGVQAGTVTADQLVVYLANVTGQLGEPDGTVDLQTSVSNLRITTSAVTLTDSLDYEISIANNKALDLDAVSSSAGDIAISTSAGTISLAAAIDTLGSFSLTSGTDLTVDSPITSAANVSLTSTAGSVTTTAAIRTEEAGTKLGQITITAANDVTIDSLVEALHDGVVVTAGKAIQSGLNSVSDPLSRISGPSASLTAGTGINVGTDIDVLSAVVTTSGPLTVSNADARNLLTPRALTVAAVTAPSEVDIHSTGDILVAGTGITTSGGNIEPFNGSADGLFRDPIGTGSFTNIGPGESDNYFVFGDSTLLFTGKPVTDVAPGEEFLLGDIDYYNGFQSRGTGVTLQIVLDFPLLAANVTASFPIDIVVHPNITGNPYSDADEILLTNLSAGLDATIGGVAYDLKLRFGTKDTSGGFASVDGFFAFEGETNNGQLYGTLVPRSVNLVSRWGDIDVQADVTASAVELSAGSLDTDGETILGGRIGGVSPNAGMISWTAYEAPSEDFYNTASVIAASLLGVGDISFTTAGSASISSASTVDGSISITALTGSLTVRDAAATSPGGSADLTLTASSGRVRLGSIAAGEAGAVTVTAGQSILDDGFDYTTIRASTVVLHASVSGTSGDIGSSENRLGFSSPNSDGAVELSVELADPSVFPQASLPANVYATSTSSLLLNVAAIDGIDVLSTGPSSDIDVQAVTLSGTDGLIVLESSRDLLVGSVTVGGGSFGKQSSIELTAARAVLLDSSLPIIESHSVSFTGGTFTGPFDLSPIDLPTVFSVTATGNSGLNVLFDRADDVVINGFSTQNGNIRIENVGSGSLLVADGGIAAGLSGTQNSVTVVSAGDIGLYDSVTESAVLSTLTLASASTEPSGVSAARRPAWEPISPTVLASRGLAVNSMEWHGSPTQVYAGQWIAKANSPSVTSASLNALFRGSSSTTSWQASSLGEGFFSISAPGSSQQQVNAWAARQGGIAYVQPDLVMASGRTPNDARYGDLWGLENTGQTGGRTGWDATGPGTPGVDIAAPAAWDVSTGSQSVVVAVIDSGVDYAHPDLAANMWRNAGEIPGNGIDDEGNGFVDDVFGWDFANGDADPMDDDGHGTHCAGTIGAVGDNGVGVVGVNWQSSIMAMKFLSPFGGSTAAAIASINYVTMMRRDFGVNVVVSNNSWGGGGYNQALRDAIEAHGQEGILFVAAAGNDFNDNDLNPTYPASYDNSNIITVAATDRNNDLAAFSNYGATSVDIAAPGVAILSTTPGNTYSYYDGTSMAAPHVAGVAALLAAARPGVSMSQLREVILNSAVPAASLTGLVATGGLLNAANAIAQLAGGGTIAAGSLVTLQAVGDIAATVTSGSIAATSAAGIVDLAVNGDTEIAVGGVTSGKSVSIAATGDILPSQGVISAPVATVSANGSVTIRTNVDTLSAEALQGDLTIRESAGLSIGSGSLKAAVGKVALTLLDGGLVGGGQRIQGFEVDVSLLDALAVGESIDIETSANVLSASTAGGAITIVNDKSFSVGSTGIVAGGASGVVLEATSGRISNPTGAGSIVAGDLVLAAVSGIAAKTKVATVTASSVTGDIALEQSGGSIDLLSVQAGNGSISLTSNDDVTATFVEALGGGRNVSITTTGTDKSITIGTNSIQAVGDTVTLSSTGGIDGTQAGVLPDVTASTLTLTSSGGDITATVEVSSLTASALGTDSDTSEPSDLDVTVLGSKILFLGTAGGVNLSAAGDLSVTTDNDIVVVATPTAGGDISLNSPGQVTFAVTTTAGSGSGSLPQALSDAGTVVNNAGGSSGVAFTTAIASPIRLASTIDIDTPLTIDGTRRLNLASGSYVSGRPIDIDGSRLTTGESGFSVVAGGDGSSISGFAFYGFNKTGGAGISVDGADDVVIRGNLFGISAAGTLGTNFHGVIVDDADGTILDRNTVVRSRDTGIRVTGGSTNSRLTANLVGTNTTRRDYGNTKYGIDLDGAGAGNVIGGPLAADANIVAFNRLAGIRLNSADGTSADPNTLQGNEVLRNATGILIEGDSDNASVIANVVTLNTADGIAVKGTASAITIGGAAAADRNFIGTNSRNSLGLGNAANGVSVSSTGAGVVIENNAILGNGTSRRANEANGVKLTGTASGTLLQGNAITANRGNGVHTTGAAFATLTKNTISSNTLSGVLVNGTSRVVVGSAASVTDQAAIRANANTINSNARYGVEVIAGAFAQIAGNSMASNRSGGILNPALARPTVTNATYTSAGLLTVTFSGVTNGQYVHVYAGTDQGRVYLGSFLSNGSTSFTMTRAEQTAAGVAASVYVGAPITATVSSNGPNGQTSPFAAVRTIRRV